MKRKESIEESGSGPVSHSDVIGELPNILKITGMSRVEAAKISESLEVLVEMRLGKNESQ